MDNYKLLKVPLMCVLLGVLMNSCSSSLKDKKREHIVKEKSEHILSTMNNDEKQALLEYKIQESAYANDTMYKSRSVKLIPTSTEECLYCWIEKDLGYQIDSCILQYDLQKDKWTTIYRDEDSEERIRFYYCIEEYRLKNNKLYCKFFTGQCGLGFEAIAFEYLDFQDGKWHFLTYGTECSEFVGDSIKADIAWIVREGENAWETEYADSIKWIKMD